MPGGSGGRRLAWDEMLIQGDIEVVNLAFLTSIARRYGC